VVDGDDDQGDEELQLATRSSSDATSGTRSTPAFRFVASVTDPKTAVGRIS
jgi:hypothetical protein